MTLPVLSPIIAAASGLILSLLLVPFVRWLSFKLGKVSYPRKDRWHTRPTPTLGGIGMFAAFLIAVGVTLLLSSELQGVRWSLLAGSTLMFAMGFVDDLRQLTPPTKLIVQVVAAAIVVFFGRTIDFFPWGFANVALTFFWLVGITNAINLLDNMDGLAGGVALIAAGFLSYFFWRAGTESLLILSLALVGAILGFLVFNFPPAKIFMGDSGTMFLGFTLASLAVAYRPRASDVFTVMGVPILLFLLPILDTSLVTITRLLRGQSPAQGGTDHTSHRLIAFGLNERQAVLALYAVALLSGVAGSILEALDYDLSLLLIPLLLIILSLLTAYLGRMKVVTASTEGTNTSAQGSLSRILVTLTYKRRIFEIILDFFLIGVSYYLAFWTHSGFVMPEASLENFLASVPVAWAGSYLSFYLSGVYRGIWRYVGMEDFLRFARAALISLVLTGGPLLLFFDGEYTLAEFFLFGVFLFLALAGSRASFRLLDHIYGRQQVHTEQERVLIYGAADAGETALRWLLNHPEIGYHPLGFVDDDPLTWGRRIHGVSVFGGSEAIESILDDKKPGGLILANPVASSNGAAECIIDACRKRGIWVRSLRLDFELVE